MVGATRGAYAEVLSLLRDKRQPNGQRVAESEALQLQVGLASARLDTAQLLVHSVADRVDSGLAGSLPERATISRDETYAVTLVLEALDSLLELSGTTGFATPRFVQQAWRDAHFAAAHQALGRRTLLSRFGRLQLGVDDAVRPFFY